jgi:hypothetical protein
MKQCDKTQLKTCLKIFIKIQEAIAKHDANQALALYLEAHDHLVAKAPLEWKLAALCQQLGSVNTCPSNWPDDLLERPSGATMAFVVSQLAAKDIPLPSALARLDPVPMGIKPLLAAAWLRQPMCHCLNDRAFRGRFIAWLTRDNAAIGLCLLAMAARGEDEQQLHELSEQWLQRGLVHPETPIQIAQASQFEILRKTVLQAIRQSLALFFQDNKALLTLLQCAFQLGKVDNQAYNITIAYSELLLPRPLKAQDKRTVLALRLAALAQLKNDKTDEQKTQLEQQVVDEYQESWMPTGWAHPYPEYLLYTLHHTGETKLEQHLLETAEFRHNMPQWVRLWRDRVLGNRSPERLFDDWDKLYFQTQQLNDEAILVGFTRALLALPLHSQEWRERVRTIWEYLANLEGYNTNMAKAFLVLLQHTDEDQIQEFEKQLYQAPLSHRFVREAALVYVSALRRRKHWKKVVSYLERPDTVWLRKNSPFEEYHFIQIMSQLEKTLPKTADELLSWLQLWERLISLPLSNEMILESLIHFDNLRKELKNNKEVSDFIFIDKMDADVYLQILRRAKATAEYLLQEQNDQWPLSEIETLRIDLRHADIGGTRNILEKLTTKETIHE